MNYREIVNDIINDIKEIKKKFNNTIINEENDLKNKSKLKENEDKEKKDDKEHQEEIYRSIFDDRNLEEYEKGFYFRSKL